MVYDTGDFQVKFCIFVYPRWLLFRLIFSLSLRKKDIRSYKPLRIQERGKNQRWQEHMAAIKTPLTLPWPRLSGYGIAIIRTFQESLPWISVYPVTWLAILLAFMLGTKLEIQFRNKLALLNNIQTSHYNVVVPLWTFMWPNFSLPWRFGVNRCLAWLDGKYGDRSLSRSRLLQTHHWLRSINETNGGTHRSVYVVWTANTSESH